MDVMALWSEVGQEDAGYNQTIGALDEIANNLPTRPIDIHLHSKLATAESVLYTGSARMHNLVVRFTAEQPNEVEDPTPITIDHGYYGGEFAYVPLRRALAGYNRIVVSYQSPRNHELAIRLAPKNIANPARLTSISSLIVARAASEIFESDQTDKIGHSMGGAHAVAVALLKPAEIRNVIIMGSTGLENQTVPMMISRSIECMRHDATLYRHELLKRFGITALPKLIKYGSRDVFLTTSEGYNVSTADIRPAVYELGHLGVRLGVLLWNKDSMFDTKTIQKNLEQIRTRQILDNAKTPLNYQVFAGNHLWPQISPDETATQILQLMNRLT
jgi:pimeloyl-ACP methyl ester carboxylesterase